MATLHNPRESEETCITCGEVVGKVGDVSSFTLMRHYAHTVGPYRTLIMCFRIAGDYIHKRRVWIAYLLALALMWIWVLDIHI